MGVECDPYSPLDHRVYQEKSATTLKNYLIFFSLKTDFRAKIWPVKLC